MGKYCHKCGSALPDDSMFCNHCGTRVGSDGSRDGWESSREREEREERSRESRRKARNFDDDEDDDERDEGGGSGAVRNTIIAIIVLAALSLWVVNRCFFNGSKKEHASITEVTGTSSQDSRDVFYNTLKDNNLMGDGATTACAMRIPAQGNNSEVIYGVTYKNETQAQKSFYKIYRLTPKGDKWEPSLLKTQSFEGRALNFDASELKADAGLMPQTPTIDGHTQFFFAYLNTPMLSGSNGQVVLCLFDPETNTVTNATYSGTFTTIDGVQRIPCDPYPGSSSKIQWLNEQARNFGILSMKSSIEVDEEKKAEEEKKKAEEEKKKKEEEEKAKAEKDKADQEKKADQASGAESKPKEQDKDKPLFSKDQIADKKSAGSHTVFLLKDGRVVRYNNSTNTSAVIFSGKAIRIGFEDTSKGILNIRTASGVIQYNLNTGAQSRKADGPAPEQKKEPAKEEKK